MLDAVLADLTVIAHFTFIVFVIGGGLLVRRFPRLLWLHLACAAWGSYVALSGSICPLTPLENYFAERAGRAGYEGGFIERYLVPIVYPEGLTPAVQRGFGAIVIAVNLAVYAPRLKRRLKSAPPREQPH
jgi:hypothetical protein